MALITFIWLIIFQHDQTVDWFDHPCLSCSSKKIQVLKSVFGQKEQTSGGQIGQSKQYVNSSSWLKTCLINE